MRLLIVEDDLDFAITLREELSGFFVVDSCGTGGEALYLTHLNLYDVLILDLNLPDVSGIEICEKLRSNEFVPAILMLTGNHELSYKVSALNSGADDYLTKPFQLEELLARIRALIRRKYHYPQKELLRVGGLTLNSTSREVSYERQKIDLRRKEFDLLEFLLISQPTIVSREMILEHVWDADVDLFTNVVDVHISNLRSLIDKRFNIKLIETVHGRGYRIKQEVDGE